MTELAITLYLTLFSIFLIGAWPTACAVSVIIGIMLINTRL